MRSFVRTAALLSIAGASGALAQSPAALPTEAPRAAAQTLLAHTGQLDLTDAQVVRLAAIARRTAARRRTMRAAVDSARTRFRDSGAADSVARRQFRDRMRADMDRAREQARADQRDALAVLTPDQQARAWDLAARRARVHGARGGKRGRMRDDFRRRGMQRGLRDRGVRR